MRAYIAEHLPPSEILHTAVVVPVLNRPHRAAPFMESLRASTVMAEVFAVCSEARDLAAWTDAGATTLYTPKVTFARKVNVGYRATDHPYLFLTGDDVTFHPRWLEYAQRVSTLYCKAVVGTNDLANPRVMSGEHGVHLLIRRNYIDEHGASWDGPGVVCHEGYGHCFVDNELVAVAKQRDEWASALDSYVEHMHPAFGKGNLDATYLLGDSKADADEATFVNRRARFAAVTV